MTPITIARLSGLFWSVSLVLSLATISPQDIERLQAVLIALASLIPLVVLGAPLPQRLICAPKIALALLLLWLLATLSCAWSVAPPISLVYLGIFSVLPATTLAILIADPRLRRPFLDVAFLGAGLVAFGLSIWTIVQIFFMPDHLVYGQVRDPFSNPNILAAILGLSFLCGLGRLFQPWPTLVRGGILFLLFWIFCGFIAITGKAAGGIMLAALAILAAVYGGGTLKRHGILLSLLAALSIGMETLMTLLPNRVSLFEQIHRLADGNLYSSIARLDLWRSTLHMIADHPFLGTGYRTFFLLYPSYRLPGEVFSGGYMAHFDALQLWAELGPLGPVLFYTVAILGGLRFLSFWRRGKALPPQKSDALCLMLGIGGFFLHSHVDFPFYAMTSAMVFGLAFGALLDATGPDQPVRPFSFMNSWPKALPAAAVLTPPAAIGILFIPLMLSQFHLTLAETALRNERYADFDRQLNAALSSGWGMGDQVWLLATGKPLAQLQNHSKTLSKEERETLFRKTDAMLNRALRGNGLLAGAWYQRGVLVQAVTPDILPPGYPDASACFRKALAINPTYLPARNKLADALQKSGAETEALAVLMDGLNWPYPTFGAFAYYNRTEALARKLNRMDLLPAIEKARLAQAGLVKSAE